MIVISTFYWLILHGSTNKKMCKCIFAKICIYSTFLFIKTLFLSYKKMCNKQLVSFWVNMNLFNDKQIHIHKNVNLFNLSKIIVY